MTQEDAIISILAVIILVSCIYTGSRHNPLYEETSYQYFIVRDKEAVANDCFLYTFKIESDHDIIEITYLDSLNHAVGDTLKLK